MARFRSAQQRDAHDEGAIAILVAVLCVVLFGAVAFSLDISSLVSKRQMLQNNLDAAVLAGAYELPNMTTATSAVNTSLNGSDPTLFPNTTSMTPSYWCIVASTGTTKTVDATQIPGVCNPGAAPYTKTKYPGLVCNERICAIPCTTALGCVSPNAMSIAKARNVPFVFAPVMGISNGSTGDIVSVACKGSCGGAPDSPMDVVVIADRTGSMSRDLATEVSAIKGMLTSMDPTQQHVAISAVGRSDVTAPICALDNETSAVQTSSPAVEPRAWLPVGLSSDFGGKNGLNASSALIQGLNCLSTNTSSTGTWLASPLRVASRYLLGTETGPGGVALRSTATKAIILETDGNPNENTITNGSTVTSANALSSSANVGNSNGTTACTNLTTIATAAKNAGILIATIDYDPSGGSTASQCNLQAMSSTDSTGAKMYYKAAAASDLNKLFKTAFAAIAGKTQLIQLPQ